MINNKSINKLTDWEWKGLDNSGYNLADGHAHQGQNPEYLKIINKLPELFLKSEKITQKETQNKFEEAFFEIAGQISYKKLKPPLYNFACSLSIEVVANYLRLNNKSVALLHPTFDNLADILKRHKIPITPIEEDALLFPEEKLKDIRTDAIFLVCPNNPTGTEITKEQFLGIIKFCKKYKKLLILDFSFRFYSSFTNWDQYDALYKSGIDFIILEDTGKTWPTLELKIGTLLASDSVYASLSDITSDFLLNVSPFSFSLLTEYIDTDKKNKSHVGAKEIVLNNLNLLKKALINLPLKLINPYSSISVAWIKLPRNWKAANFCRWLSVHNIHVLPGSPFFWNDPERGESYIRIALLRPNKQFRKSMEVFERVVLLYEN